MFPFASLSLSYFITLRDVRDDVSERRGDGLNSTVVQSMVLRLPVSSANYDSSLLLSCHFIGLLWKEGCPGSCDVTADTSKRRGTCEDEGMTPRE